MNPYLKVIIAALLLFVLVSCNIEASLTVSKKETIEVTN